LLLEFTDEIFHFVLIYDSDIVLIVVHVIDFFSNFCIFIVNIIGETGSEEVTNDIFDEGSSEILELVEIFNFPLEVLMVILDLSYLTVFSGEKDIVIAEKILVLDIDKADLLVGRSILL